MMLSQIDRSPLSGLRKLWCWHLVGLPRFRWKLLIYDIAYSNVERLERLATRFMRKWLCTSRTLSTCALYGSMSKLVLPFSSVLTEYKAATVQWQLQVDDSTDPSLANVTVGSAGRKWSSTQARDHALPHLRWSEYCRGQTSQAGLGVVKHTRISRLKGEGRRRAIISAVRQLDGIKRHVNLHSLSQQGAFTRWKGVANRCLKWGQVLMLRCSRFTFLIGSVYDVLPFQANLKCMGRVDDAKFRVCGERDETLDHVLSGCPRSLASGRYRFRHDMVLGVLERCVRNQVGLARSKPDRTRNRTSVRFVKPGFVGNTIRTRACGSLLIGSTDWDARVDRGNALVFPENIVGTSLRPDSVIWSDSIKRIIIAELTVPLERCVLDAHERKCKKYEHLVQECKESSWKVDFFAVEVGCRGFPTSLLSFFLGSIGLQGRSRSSAIDEICNRAESVSFWIWCKRGDVAWDPGHFRPQLAPSTLSF